MNSETTIKTPATRREMLGYAQVAAFILLLGVAIASLLWVMVLRPEWIDLGAVDGLNATSQPCTRSHDAIKLS